MRNPIDPLFLTNKLAKAEAAGNRATCASLVDELQLQLKAHGQSWPRGTTERVVKQLRDIALSRSSKMAFGAASDQSN